MVSRTWRKVKADWESWNRRSLAEEDVVRLILDGTVVKVRLDRRSTGISLLVVLGVRRDGRKITLSVRNMGGESKAAWRAALDDLIARGLRMPDLLLINGGSGLERALAALWPEVPTQRCIVHKHRNLLAHASQALHEEITADHNDMVYAESSAMADGLEEAGERLFTFTRLPSGQWQSGRTTNAIERLHEEFTRRIKTQTVLPSTETAVMLFWFLLAAPDRSPCGKFTAGRASANCRPHCLLILPPELSVVPTPEAPSHRFPQLSQHHRIPSKRRLTVVHYQTRDGL